VRKKALRRKVTAKLKVYFVSLSLKKRKMPTHKQHICKPQNPTRKPKFAKELFFAFNMKKQRSFGSNMAIIT
jgi:hypothetical protein